MAEQSLNRHPKRSSVLQQFTLGFTGFDWQTKMPNAINRLLMSSPGTYIIYHHHHHHVVPLAWISPTLPRHFSLSFIASGRPSGLHPVFSHICCMYVRAGRPAFARPYVGVHRSTSLMSLSLLLQQCPACLMGGRWPYSWRLVGSAYFIFDLFEIKVIESFNFWMKLIQESAIFLPKYFRAILESSSGKH